MRAARASCATTMPWRATTPGGGAAADGALSTKARACGNAAPSEPMQKKRASKLLRGNAQISSIRLTTIYLLAVMLFMWLATHRILSEGFMYSHSSALRLARLRLVVSGLCILLPGCGGN